METPKADREIRMVRLTFITYVVLTALQVGAFLITDVLVLLAQSLDRASDILISLFFLISLYISRRPADPLHAFGHTRVQNVAALIVSSVLILFISIEIFRGAIPRLFDPSLVDTNDLGIAMAVTVFSMVVIAVPTIFLLRNKAPGLSRAQLFNLLLDEFSCGVSVVAIALIALGYPIADPIASIVVGMAIFVTGIVLLRENIAILIGSSPDEDFKRRLEEAAMSVNGVKGIHGIRAEYVGPETIHADLHIEIHPDTRVVEADQIAQAVRKKIMETTECQYCEVHSDPFGPSV